MTRRIKGDGPSEWGKMVWPPDGTYDDGKAHLAGATFTVKF